MSTFDWVDETPEKVAELIESTLTSSLEKKAEGEGIADYLNQAKDYAGTAYNRLTNLSGMEDGKPLSPAWDVARLGLLGAGAGGTLGLGSALFSGRKRPLRRILSGATLGGILGAGAGTLMGASRLNQHPDHSPEVNELLEKAVPQAQAAPEAPNIGQRFGHFLSEHGLPLVGLPTEVLSGSSFLPDQTPAQKAILGTAAVEMPFHFLRQRYANPGRFLAAEKNFGNVQKAFKDTIAESPASKQLYEELSSLWNEKQPLTRSQRWLQKLVGNRSGDYDPKPFNELISKPYEVPLSPELNIAELAGGLNKHLAEAAKAPAAASAAVLKPNLAWSDVARAGGIPTIRPRGMLASGDLQFPNFPLAGDKGIREALSSIAKTRSPAGREALWSRLMADKSMGPKMTTTLEKLYPDLFKQAPPMAGLAGASKTVGQLENGQVLEALKTMKDKNLLHPSAVETVENILKMPSDPASLQILDKLKNVDVLKSIQNTGTHSNLGPEAINLLKANPLNEANPGAYSDATRALLSKAPRLGPSSISPMERTTIDKMLGSLTEQGAKDVVNPASMQQMARTVGGRAGIGGYVKDMARTGVSRGLPFGAAYLNATVGDKLTDYFANKNKELADQARYQLNPNVVKGLNQIGENPVSPLGVALAYKGSNVYGKYREDLVQDVMRYVRLHLTQMNKGQAPNEEQVKHLTTQAIEEMSKGLKTKYPDSTFQLLPEHRLPGDMYRGLQYGL